jgi:hypothetical protein
LIVPGLSPILTWARDNKRGNSNKEVNIFFIVRILRMDRKRLIRSFMYRPH